MRARKPAAMVAAICLVGFVSNTAVAQQVTGELGSPAATITLDGKQLPAPDMPFGGKIDRNALQS